MALDRIDTNSYVQCVTVSPVRRGLREDRLGPYSRVRDAAQPGDPSAELGRSDAVAWVRRRLLWEHRLAGLREQARAGDDCRVGEGAAEIPLAE